MGLPLPRARAEGSQDWGQGWGVKLGALLGQPLGLRPEWVPGDGHRVAVRALLT